MRNRSVVALALTTIGGASLLGDLAKTFFCGSDAVTVEPRARRVCELSRSDLVLTIGIEPVRSTVDVLVLELIASKGIRPYMFLELRDGVVRLDPDFARPLALWLMPRLRKPLAEVAAGYVTQLKRVEVPYRLTRFARRQVVPNGPTTGTKDVRILPSAVA